MKKILVLTDFSDPSKTALELAIEIAEAHEGVVILLHVLDMPKMSSNWIDYGFEKTWEETVEEAEKTASKRLSDSVGGEGRNKHLITKVLTGSLLETILEFQENENFDLLVIGAKRTPNIGAYLFGTRTDKIVHRSDIPVLVVKKKTSFEGIKNVLVGNALRLDNHDLVSYVEAIRKLTGGHIKFLRVNTPIDFMSQDVFDERIEHLREETVLKNYEFNYINFKSQGDGLIYYAAKSKSDLIVICDKHRSSFRRWVIGEDLAEEVMDASDLPVLIL
ncbi:MAG: universal stress protein [Cyclobacteriaceae bacterium]